MVPRTMVLRYKCRQSDAEMKHAIERMGNEERLNEEVTHPLFG